MYSVYDFSYHCYKKGKKNILKLFLKFRIHILRLIMLNTRFCLQKSNLYVEPYSIQIECGKKK